MLLLGREIGFLGSFMLFHKENAFISVRYLAFRKDMEVRPCGLKPVIRTQLFLICSGEADSRIMLILIIRYLFCK